MLEKILPKKFLCKYSLSVGALIGGITFIAGKWASILQYKRSSYSSRLASVIKAGGSPDDKQLSSGVPPAFIQLHLWHCYSLKRTEKVIAVLCIIGLMVQLLTSYTAGCSDVTWVNAFSFTATDILYHLLLVLADAWMMWGVSQKKSSILLAWVILSAMWLAQTFCMLVVMILLRRSEVALGVWITYLVLTVILTSILAYLVLVVCGLWLKMKVARRSRHLDEAAHNENL